MFINKNGFKVDELSMKRDRLDSSKGPVGRFSLAADGLLQLMFVVFAIGFLSLVGLSFLLDWAYQYAMCEICLLQRFVMLALGVFSVLGAVFVKRIWGLGVVSFVAVGLCLGLGLGFAVTHAYMILSAASGASTGHACKMVSEMTFMPNFWYDYFHSRYQFIPCDQVSSGLLGIGFPYWALIIYIGSSAFFSLILCMCFRVGAVHNRRFKIDRSSLVQAVQALITFALVIFFCVWMAASLYFVSVQRKILYKPDRYSEVHQKVLHRVDAIRYAIASGDQYAFSYPKAKALPAHARRNLWIVLWGRDAMALDAFFGDHAWTSVFNQLSSQASFLMVDYPGFGWNSGFPTERSNRDSVLKAYQAWRAYHGLSAEEPVNVYILAHSMGTGVAVDVARSLSEISGVVLMSPFVSIFQMSKVLLGSWIAWTVRPFLLDRYPTGQRLSQLHDQLPELPVAIFHGDSDVVIPVSHSQNMVQANQWIQYYERPGLGHSKRDFAGDQMLKVMRNMMHSK